MQGPITPRGEDSWDGHMNTDFVRKDYIDSSVLEECVNGRHTKVCEYVTIDTMQVVSEMIGMDEFIPGVPNFVYVKPEHVEQALEKLRKKIELLTWFE